MRYLRKYNESELRVTDETIKEIVHSEIEKFGNNVDLNHIDVSLVTNMNNMFFKIPFNGDISRWDVGSLKYMSKIFSGSNFDRDISRWDVRNVEGMREAFSYSKFSGSLKYWETRSLLDYSYIFYNDSKNYPWWYSIGNLFKSHKLMWDSIDEWKWIDVSNGIIWQKRLNYALKDSGRPNFEIPDSIWEFKIVN